MDSHQFWRLPLVCKIGLVLLSALTMAAPVSAAPVVRGSSLAEGPMFPLGCDQMPFLSSTPNLGDYSFPPSGKADCTWRQSAVFGVQSDPRHSSVPADGRITQISVRSGPSPSPLRFTILRQLAAPGAGDNCCFFVSETAPVQPQPNTVTSFAVNIPVERNFKEAVMGTDMVAVSGVAGAGSLPLRVVGNTNALVPFQLGSPIAGFWYSRMGAEPGDAGGGRREGTGIPNVELLIQWVFCATGDASCQPTVPQTVQRQGSLAALGSQFARIRANSALIRMVCNGDVLCEGRLELVNLGAVASAKKKTTVYGRASYKLTVGQKKTVKLKLNRKGKRLVKKKNRAKVGIRFIPKSGAQSTARLTLRR